MTLNQVHTWESVAVDGLAAHAIALREVSALDHELGDHTVELATLVVQWLALQTKLIIYV
jgi:hypothetical protein